MLQVDRLYHGADRMIVSHAHRSLFAHLLMRIAENRVGEGWPMMRKSVERVSVSRIETE